MNRQECPGCDMARGVICDDCLELLERRLDSSDVLGGLIGLFLVVLIALAIGALVFGQR